MLATEAPKPKVVGIRVLKAENLRIPLKPDGKHRKHPQKWKVVVHGAKKKMSTESAVAPMGNPQWDCELTVKVPRSAEPLCLLVTDSDDHHVGQVVIPVSKIPSRPANPNERPTDPSRLSVADLEPTKKNSTAVGTLYYWIWVNEYRTEEKQKKGSSKGSVLSLSALKSKQRSPVADSLTYSGSVISMNSSQVELRDGRKKGSVLSRRSTRDIFKSAADISQLPKLGIKQASDKLPKRSTQSIYDPTFRSLDDQDGSVLGAPSELMDTRSNISIRPAPAAPPLPPPHPTRASLVKRADSIEVRSISPVVEERPSSALNVGQPSLSNSTTRPELIRIEPTSCSTAGGVEVIVYAAGLTDEVMRYASVLVDGYNVPRQDWFLEADPDSTDRCKLHIHMPERPTGRCWIEVETMNHGRLRCPQEFVYINQPVAAPSRPSDAELSSTNEPEPPLSSFNQSGEDMMAGSGHVKPPNGPLTDYNDKNDVRNNQLPEPRITPYQMADSSSEEEESDDDFPLHESASHRSAASGQSKNSFLDSSPPPVTSGKPPRSPPDSQHPFDDSGISSLYPFAVTPKQSARLDAKSTSPESFAQSDPSTRSTPQHLKRGGTPLDAMDENARLENESLRSMLGEANRFIDAMKLQTVELEKKLSERNADVDRLSSELCQLRNQLLRDGMTKYLERQSRY